MRTTIARLVVPVLLAAACTRGASDKGQLSEDLKRDLDATSGSKIELANGAAAYQPMRFVSEIEQTESSTPTTRIRAPKRVAARSAKTQQDETESPAPETQQEVQVAETPTPEAQTPSPAADVPAVPSVSPRPSPMTVEYPAAGGNGTGGEGNGRGEGRGVEIGDVIGVIIRGGGVGPDHCPPRRRGRGRIPIILR